MQLTMELYSAVVEEMSCYRILGIYNKIELAKSILKDNLAERIDGDGYFEYIEVNYIVYKHELNDEDVDYEGKYSTSKDNIVFQKSITNDYFRELNQDKEQEEFEKKIDEDFK